MKNTATLLLIAFSIFNLLFAQLPNRILGLWENEDRTIQVKVSLKNNYYQAIIYSINGSTSSKQVDSENKNKSLKSRTLIGVPVWMNFVYSPDRNHWSSGEIYNINSGHIYNGKIRVKDDELLLTGYYGIFFFLAKTQKWHRVK